MGYVNECFLCGRKDIATVPGRFAPTIEFEDIDVRYCIECVQQMQEDYEHFFEGLNWPELGRKYVKLWSEINKRHLKGRGEAIEKRIQRYTGKENASGRNENLGNCADSIGRNGRRYAGTEGNTGGGNQDHGGGTT